VPREERGVAAPADEALDRVAHLPRPVLVVPDAQIEAVWVERVGTRVEVEAGEEVETNAPRPRPGAEAPLPVVPARRPAPHTDPVLDEVLDPSGDLAIAGPALVRQPVVRGGRACEESLRERSFERDARCPHVEIRAAPVVVGTPRRGG